MKLSSKIFTTIALILAISFSANAQRGERKAQDPEKRAAKQTAQMIEKLALSEDQATKVQEINLAYAIKMKEARENNKESREAMKEMRKEMDSAKNAELKAVLTQEQFQTLETMEKQRKPRRGKGKSGNRS